MTTATNNEPGRHPAEGDASTLDDRHPRRHRRHRDRRHAAWLRWQGQAQLTAEEQDFVEFALTWAPFGGPPGEETFLRFGMTSARFAERLWQLVQDGRISVELSRSFAEVYSPRSARPTTDVAPPPRRGSGTGRRTRAAVTR
ncbi:hypothetical protein [Rhodococcus jostii]|uniref:hypothetical protein n=1 Tax=Rhodococcus jostii TaxID=132919 RepID=UPI0036462BBE